MRLSQRRTESASRRARARAHSSALARSPVAQSWRRTCAASCRRARARPASMAACASVQRRSQSASSARRASYSAEHEVLPRGGARGGEVRPGGVEFAAADLDLATYEHEPVPEARGDAVERGGTEPLGLVPVADRDQCLDLVHDEQDALNPVPVHLLEPRLPQSRRLSRPAQHRQRVGEIHVRPFQADEIAESRSASCKA